ncbi:entericidin [Ciceribacter sp. L1K23]|uniref:entericidin domain-containing protein n=1 Tax=unclassified Ciceribacter TaxID=2628820 RepID=UPI001ABE568B|nr:MULTISPECIES: entericidin [unclassified Ciceribacter]MBO3760424.1 entericidin [Ciceribacter sp. L1K22]MBR0555522.1 entericidin [Ciceribacter sp. L1K23]
MKKSTTRLAVAASLFASVALLAGCGNTIRGMGQDTANAVDATQDAGQRVDNAASY